MQHSAKGRPTGAASDQREPLLQPAEVTRRDALRCEEMPSGEMQQEVREYVALRAYCDSLLEVLRGSPRNGSKENHAGSQTSEIMCLKQFKDVTDCYSDAHDRMSALANRIIESFMPDLHKMSCSILRRYLSNRANSAGLDEQDLTQIAAMRVMEELKKYDPATDTASFAACAIGNARRTLWRELRRRLIGGSSEGHPDEQERAIRKGMDRLKNEGMRYNQDGSQHSYDMCIVRAKATLNAEQPPVDGNGNEQIIAVDFKPTPIQAAAQREMLAELMKACESLPAREAEVVVKIFLPEGTDLSAKGSTVELKTGAPTLGERSTREVAEEMGVSTSLVKKLLTNALRTLRTILPANFENELDDRPKMQYSGLAHASSTLRDD